MDSVSTRSSSNQGGSGAAARPVEVEDWLNRWIYHALAQRVARVLAPTGISPNAVSVAGVLLVWAAAWAYTFLPWPSAAAIGLLLHASWHIVDGADGDLARLTGRASPTGEMVDGVCDYAGHGILYIALAALLDGTIGLWAWPLGFAAALSHGIQTNHSECQRRNYLYWAYGRPWLKHARKAGDEVFRARNWFTLTFGWMARVYLRLAARMNPEDARVDRIVEAAGGDPSRIARILSAVREQSRVSLGYQKLLGANPRTLMLGASMAAGSPILYFLAECLLLNAVMWLSVRHHRASARALLARIEPVVAS